MLKWIFLGLMGAILLVVGGLYGFGKLILYGGHEEGTFTGDVYETVMETRMTTRCNLLFKEIPGILENNSDKQLKSTCKCFSDLMFEKVRGISPDDLEAHLNKPATQKTAEALLERCAHQSGLAYE